MSRESRILILAALVAASFSFATLLQPRAVDWKKEAQNQSVLKLLLGDTRRVLANHLFVKADIYFHSGYYPSIFDRGSAPVDTKHMGGHEEEGGHDAEHEKEMDFLKPPRDWIEGFGRHFFVTRHTHLEGGNEREILPWLKASAELDPQHVETYTVAAYWLRRRLGKVKEAEEFLREGLRENPNSYEILFALGQLYYENQNDSIRARNLWELALRRWREQETGKKDPDTSTLEEITVRLARLEEDQGHLAQAIEYLEQAKKTSPNAASLQNQINEMKQKLAGPAKPPDQPH
jgi:tetratricopeptide (TPR) repeat protein